MYLTWLFKNCTNCGVTIGIVSTPLLCFNISTERIEVNVSFSVMMPPGLHLTEFFFHGAQASKMNSMVVELVGQ